MRFGRQSDDLRPVDGEAEALGQGVGVLEISRGLLRFARHHVAASGDREPVRLALARAGRRVVLKRAGDAPDRDARISERRLRPAHDEFRPRGPIGEIIHHRDLMGLRRVLQRLLRLRLRVQDRADHAQRLRQRMRMPDLAPEFQSRRRRLVGIGDASREPFRPGELHVRYDAGIGGIDEFMRVVAFPLIKIERGAVVRGGLRDVPRHQRAETEEAVRLHCLLDVARRACDSDEPLAEGEHLVDFTAHGAEGVQKPERAEQMLLLRIVYPLRQARRPEKLLADLRRGVSVQIDELHRQTHSDIRFGAFRVFVGGAAERGERTLEKGDRLVGGELPGGAVAGEAPPVRRLDMQPRFGEMLRDDIGPRLAFLRERRRQHPACARVQLAAARFEQRMQRHLPQQPVPEGMAVPEAVMVRLDETGGAHRLEFRAQFRKSQREDIGQQTLVEIIPDDRGGLRDGFERPERVEPRDQAVIERGGPGEQRGHIAVRGARALRQFHKLFGEERDALRFGEDEAPHPR